MLRFRNIHAMDVSQTIISVMQEQYKDYNGVSFSIMDVRELSGIANGSISVVIDKGCIDAVFCSTNFLNDTRHAFKEIYRVLQNNGVFVSFSHAPGNCRVPFLRVVDWSIDVCTCPYGEGINMYTLIRTTDTSLLNKKIDGAESVVMGKVSHAVSSLDQPVAHSSTTKHAGGAGFVTVTASVDVLTSMVNESEDVDS